MSPKSSQPLLLQIHKKKKIFGISCTFWYICVQNLEKSIFGYSLTFHNDTCTKNMIFQKAIFYTSDCIDSCSNYRILGSGKVFL